MSDQHKPEALFSTIESFVSESQRLLEEGTLVDATGLDDHVRSLCEAVMALSQEQRLIHAERMQELLLQLNQLGAAMVAQRDALAEELRGLQQKKKAHQAYKSADAVDHRFGRPSDKKDK